MVVKYRDMEITYLEDSNGWFFANKSYQSLKRAKEAVDRAYKKEFERLEAFWVDWGVYVKVTVTSLTSEGEAWIVDEGGSRHKTRPRALFEYSPENQEKVNKASEMRGRAETLSNEANDLLRSMTRLVLVREEDKAGAESQR